MQHLALIVALAPSAAAEEPLHLSGRFGMLAIESGATTRAPALELVLSARWPLLVGVGPALSYRGGWRDAGGDTVGMTTLVHRFQLGVFAQHAWTRVLAGAEVGVHGRFETTSLRAAGVASQTRSSRAFGMGLDVWGGVRFNERLSLSLVAGAYQRREMLDLTLGLAVDWAL